MNKLRIVLTVALLALAGLAQADPTGGVIFKPTANATAHTGF